MLSWWYVSISFCLGNVRWIVSYIIEVCFSQVTRATVNSDQDASPSNSQEIHALKAEIKEEIKREVLDSKSKIVDKLKESVRGDLTEIVKKDVAECNAKILGELKDSLLPSIKYGHGELKDNLKQDTRWC